LNSIFHNIIGKKASIIACLFLFLSSTLKSQDWNFDVTTQQAYMLTLNLQTDKALALLQHPKTAHQYYVVSLAEILELAITEDAETFSEYEKRFEARQEENIKGSTAEIQFVHAEILLQWTFIYLKFGREFDAAIHLRQAYQIANDCYRKNPKYLPIKKTMGMLNVIIGSVPEKYNWVLGLLGIEGNIKQGLQDLDALRITDHPLAFEADLLYALIQGFILQQPGIAIHDLKKLLEKNTNRLALFLAATLAIKNSESETALIFLQKLATHNEGLPLHYAEYLKGEVYLHKAEYMNAITSYRWFINHYTGQNYIKDAYYKIGICYYLNGFQNDALTLFKEAKGKGREATEADKHAARYLAENVLPNIKLSKVRYFTDGGYFQEAQQVLDTIIPAEIPSPRDQVEFYYRKARLFHKTNQLPAAKLFYQQTIEMTQNETWYFAPNACLQMGYIALSENDISKAKEYFTRTLQYKKYEYQNSIDSKAKTALAQLKRR
jgi:hypothetical protein